MAWQDLRHALRFHRQQPLVAIAVVLTLALGIGANTAIFNIVSAVLLKPLDYPQGDRLIFVRQTYDSLRTSPNPRLQAIWNDIPVSYLNTSDWRSESRTLAGIGLYNERAITLTGQGEPRALAAAQVDSEVFAVLRTAPLLGRIFNAEEVARGDLVVLGHGLWQQIWGGDSDILDRAILLDGTPHTVIGVMPAGFSIIGGQQDSLWLPLELDEEDLQSRNHQWLNAVARLADGATLHEARDELDRLAAQQALAWPDSNDGVGVHLEPVFETLVGDSRPLLWMLMATAAVVLAIACVNVAHLLLAQAQSRRIEFAIRSALGARRIQLAKQLLIESVCLALMGGLAGVMLASSGQHLLLAWIPTDLPRTDELAIDRRVLTFALILSFLTAFACGLAPTLASLREAPARSFGNGQRAGRDPRSLWQHDSLVVAELALTLMLTVAASLLVTSFLRLSAVEPGFRTGGLLIQDLQLPEWSYANEPRRQELIDRLLPRLNTLPGVRTTALTTKLPFAGPALVAGFSIPGADSAVDSDTKTDIEDWTQGSSASLKFVSPRYFDALGIAVRRGRAFTAADRPQSGRTVVMNESLAEYCWPGENPIGREVVFADRSYTVIGIVADIRHDGLAKDPGALMYFPWSQRSDLPVLADRLTVVLAVEAIGKAEGQSEGLGEPLTLAPRVRQVLHDLDPTLPVPAATTVNTLMAESLGTPKAQTSLVVLLAALAMMLALVGTFAVLSFSVGQRTSELGVRMALGATSGQIRALVLRRTLTLTTCGIALGTLGSWAAGRLLTGMLWGVEPNDPAILAIAALLLVVTAGLAGWLPAYRASRVDPLAALRNS